MYGMSSQPSFVHLVLHHPAPEHAADVTKSMQRVADAASGSPGLLHIGPWRDVRTGQLFGLSVWESEDAFRSVMPQVFASVDDPDPDGTWDAAPPDVYHLVPARTD